MDNYIFKKDAALTKEESNNFIKYVELNKNPQKDTTRGYFYFHPVPSLEWPEFKFLEIGILFIFISNDNFCLFISFFISMINPSDISMDVFANLSISL